MATFMAQGGTVINQKAFDIPSRGVTRRRCLGLFRSHGDLAVALALALLAGALRLCNLDEIPPGLHFDEAYNSLDALGVLSGERPIFFSGNFGREPLFIYLVSLAFTLFGASPAVIRGVSGLSGALAVALTYGIGRLLWPGQRRTAVYAALIQGFLPWDLHFSRYGIRVELLPFLGNAAVLFLLRGWRDVRLRWFMLSGAFLGLALYGYMSARLLPFVFLGWAALAVAKADAAHRRRLLVGLSLLALTAALVFLPLGAYFIRNPVSFTARASQVAIIKGEPAEVAKGLLDNAWRWLKAFPIEGDENPRNNLPGAPALTPWLILPWALGLVLALRGALRPERGLLCLWFGIMLLPSILSDYAPSFQRASGAVPALALLTALGLERLERAVVLLRNRTAPNPSRHPPQGRAQTHESDNVTSRRTHYASLLAVLLLIGHGAQAMHQYFFTWGRSNALYYAFDEGIYQIGEYMRERVLAGETVYLSPVRPDHATLHFLMRDVGGPVTFDGRRLFVLPPPDGKPVEYIVLTREDALSLRQARTWYPSLETVNVFRDRLGQEYAIAVRANSDGVMRVSPRLRVTARWEGGIVLEGLEGWRHSSLPHGILFTAYWRAEREMDLDYTSFLHVIGPYNEATQGPLWSGADAMPGSGCYPTSAWRPGELVIERRVLTLPEMLSEGDYYLEVGWYLLETGQRLRLTEPKAGEDRLLIGPYHVGD